MQINECPFCFSIDTQYIDGGCSFKAAVVCMHCFASGPKFEWPDYTTRKNWRLRMKWRAITAWNKRTYPMNPL